MKKFFTAFAILGILLTGCGNSAQNKTAAISQTDAEQPYSEDIFAMDTFMTITAYGDGNEAAVKESVSEIERLDALLSISSETGDIKALNQSKGASVEISEETANLIKRAIDIGEKTDGNFNCTVLPLMELWGFTTQVYQVPTENEISEVLAKINPDNIKMEENKAVLADGVSLDLGGIAKGYASSRIMEVFQENGVVSGMVSLGGNVHTIGTKPDGKPWRIAIQDPFNLEEVTAVVEVDDKAVITSGGYQRFFEQDGKTYHHIIDPATGYPAQSGLASCTIIAKDGTLADGLSTALFVMGVEKASEFWKTHTYDFDAVFITENNEVYITEGIADDFAMQDDTADYTIIFN